VRAFLVVSGLAVLACSGADVIPAVQEQVVAPAPPSSWPVVVDEGKTLVKAGTSEGVALDATLVLLGPPLAGTDNRAVVGSARVAETWPDLARLEPIRLGEDAPEAARAMQDGDAALLSAIPEVEKAERKLPPGLAGGPLVRGRSTGPSSRESASESDVTLPADLRSGDPDARQDALRRYEGDPAMTAAIVHVMKNDASHDVRFKAWRVVRARWQKGTGEASQHEAAAAWLAGNGGVRERKEAVDATGDLGTSLTAVVARLEDGAPGVRQRAALAVAAVGRRTGKSAEARAALRARQAKETDSDVLEKIAEGIGRL
jgi:hypothetical protein